MPIRHPKSAIINPGGPGEIRTLDLLSAIEARSQLRYRPVYGRGVFYLRQVGMSSKLPAPLVVPPSPPSPESHYFRKLCENIAKNVLVEERLSISG